MSDKHKDVLIAAYLFEDLAKKDFDALLKPAEEKTITVEGVVLVQKDHQGEVHVEETGDDLGLKGAKLSGGVGLVVGLFAPPLLAAAVGVAAGAAVHLLRDPALEPVLCELARDLASLLPLGAAIVMLPMARDRAVRILGLARDWLLLHARTVAAVIVVLLAAALLRNGIAGLT